MATTSADTPTLVTQVETPTFACSICQDEDRLAKAGPGCKACPAFTGTHYLPSPVERTDPSGHNAPDLIFLGDVPSEIPRARDGEPEDVRRLGFYHEPFSCAGGRVIKGVVRELTETSPGAANVKLRYLYAVKCAVDKPNKAVITACSTPLIEEVSRYERLRDVAGRKHRLVVVAHGVTALRAAGVVVAKFEDADGRVFESHIGGVPVIVVATMSLAATAATAAGKYSSLKAAIGMAFDLARNTHGASQAPRAEIEAGYIYPVTLPEVRDLVDMIIGYAANGFAPEQWAISFDTETNTLHPHRDTLKWLTATFAWDTGKACSIPLFHAETPYDPHAALVHVKRLLACPKPKVGHNIAKYDQKVVWKYGAEMVNLRWDSLCGEHAREEDKKGQYGLKAITKIHYPAFAGYEDKLHEFLDKEEGEDQGESIRKLRDDGKKIVPVPAPVLEALTRLGVKPTFAPKTLAKRLDEAAAQGQEAVVLDIRLLLAAKKAGEFRQKTAKKDKNKDGGFEKVPLKELNFYGAVDADLSRRYAVKQTLLIRQENDAIAVARQRVAISLSKGGSAYKVQIPCADPNPIAALVRDRYMPRAKVLARMEYDGVKINKGYLEEAKVELDRVVRETEQKIYEMAGAEFKINAPKQLGYYLFDVGQGFIHPDPDAAANFASKPDYRDTLKWSGKRMSYKALSKTKKGALQANEKTLKTYVTAYECPFSDLVLLYKKASKARNTFMKGVEELSYLDGMIHANFNLLGTSTGRLSCIAAGTRIETNAGPVAVEFLAQYCAAAPVYALTHNGRWRRITAVFTKGVEAMYDVTLSTGARLRCTMAHRVQLPDGSWAPLRQLAIGDEVVTHGASTGKRIRQDLHHGTPQLAASFKTLWDSAAPLSSDALDVLRQVPRATKARSRRTLRAVEARQQARGSRRAVDRTRRQGAGRQVGTRVDGTPSSETLHVQRVYGSPEHSLPQHPLPDGDACPGVYRESQRGTAGQTRWASTGAAWSGGVLLQGPGGLLSEGVCRAPATHGSLAFVEAHRQGAVQLLLEGSTVEYVLEHQRIRSGIGASADRSRDSAHSATHGRSEQEGRLARRFSRGRSIVRGDRWGVPRNTRGTPDRPEEGSVHRQDEACASSDHNPGRSYAASLGNDRDPSAFAHGVIHNIRFAGFEVVWDLSVDEDESYVAEGFVNHNSSNPNLQNIPKGFLGAKYDKGGKDLLLDAFGVPVSVGVNCKRLFIADSESDCIVNADAKGAEVTMFAGYAKDPALIEALLGGLDAHCFFGAQVLNPDLVARDKNGAPLHGEAKRVALANAGIDDEHGWTYEDFLLGKDDKHPDKAYGKRLKKLRDNIKRVVFGILFGAKARKIAEIAGITETLAQTIQDLLFAKFSTIPRLIDSTIWELSTFGFVETFHGRRRRFPIKHAPKKIRAQAERRAVNFKIQGTNSDIVLDTLVAIEEVLRRDLRGRMLLTVHDSLVFQVPKIYVGQIKDLMYEYGTKRVNAANTWLPVQYRWDVEAGPSYGDLQAVEKYAAGLPAPNPVLSGAQSYTEEEQLVDLSNSVWEEDDDAAA